MQSPTLDRLAERLEPDFHLAVPEVPGEQRFAGEYLLGFRLSHVLVNPLGGSFNNLVTLSATGLPPGATVSFAPPAVTPGSTGASSVMSIQMPGLAHLALPDSHQIGRAHV